jgi:hypothetical protein
MLRGAFRADEYVVEVDGNAAPGDEDLDGNRGGEADAARKVSPRE